MKYILDYNEKTGQFRIYEVGKTLTSLPDDADFQRIGGADDMQELCFFVHIVNVIRVAYFIPILPSVAHVQRMFEGRTHNADGLQILKIRCFEPGEF